MNGSNCEKLKVEGVGGSVWKLKTKKSGVTKWVAEKLEEWIEKPNVFRIEVIIIYNIFFNNISILNLIYQI